MGLYDALREFSLQVPQDVAIVGFDNQEIISAHLRPALSSVGLPHYELGYESVKWLVDNQTRSTMTPGVRCRLECPRVLRESV